MPPAPTLIGPAQIEAARTRIAGRVRRTPVLGYDREDDGAAPVWLKLESLQHAGSFKVRGAFATVLAEIDAGRPPRRLVAASGGNHGLAVAHVGRALGIPARIFVPTTSSPVKRAAIQALGADLVAVGDAYADAAAASVDAAAEPGSLGIHAYDALATVAGQGTLGAELDEQVPDLDTVLVAVGGGGLMAGIAAWFGERAHVVAVEPDRCPTLHAALAAGAPQDVEVGGVAADALGAQRVGDLAFGLAREHAVGSLLVSDDDIRTARQRLWDDVRLVVEPAGATALAALTSGAYRPGNDQRVAVVLCGANTDPSDLA